MTVEVKTKKWGNSIGVVLPKELVEKQNIKENEKIMINIIKETDLSDIFGSLKGRIKINSQKLKDLLREEEAEAEKRKWGK